MEIAKPKSLNQILDEGDYSSIPVQPGSDFHHSSGRTSKNRMNQTNTFRKKLPLVMEIIGLAGTGKSTLSNALYQQNRKILASERLGFKRSKHRLFFITQAFSLLPTFFPQARNRYWLSREEIKKIVYLQGWHRVLLQQGRKNNAIVVVDQGAIYKLATLYGFGHEKLKDQRFDKWWNHLFEQWASTIDMVIWLDGPDDTLIERINSRDSWHLVKEFSPQQAQEYFFDYRMAFKYILSRLTSIEDITVLHFDTSSQSPEEITAEVMKSVGGTDGG